MRTFPIMVDVDDDGDLDLVLTDEATDHMRILQNGGGPSRRCPPSPGTCRLPTASAASSLLIQERTPADRDRLGWKWAKGAATSKTDFGNPVTTDGYTLCVYDAAALVASARVAGSCGAKPCWTEKATGFQFRNRSLQPSGVQSLKLLAGVDGKAAVAFKGKGASLAPRSERRRRARRRPAPQEQRQALLGRPLQRPVPARRRRRAEGRVGLVRAGAREALSGGGSRVGSAGGRCMSPSPCARIRPQAGGMFEARGRASRPTC